MKKPHFARKPQKFTVKFHTGKKENHKNRNPAHAKRDKMENVSSPSQRTQKRERERERETERERDRERGRKKGRKRREKTIS